MSYLNAPIWRRLRRDERGELDLPSIMVSILVIGAFLAAAGLVVAVVVPWAQRNAEKQRAARGESSDEPSSTPTPEPTYTPEPVAPREPADLSWVPGVLVVIGLIVLGIVLVAVGVWASRKGLRARTARLSAQASTASAWAAVRDRHKDARMIFASYETDVAKAIDYPAFNDLSVPEVKAMVQAMRQAQDLESATNKTATIGGTDAQLEAYRTAVTALSTAVDLAERTAKKLAWQNMSPEEQTDLKQAKSLLAHASDPGNTVEARQTYYGRLQTVIRRLNDRHNVEIIPAKVVAELEQQARLELAA